jgi:hypothetical protein
MKLTGVYMLKRLLAGFEGRSRRGGEGELVQTIIFAWM